MSELLSDEDGITITQITTGEKTIYEVNWRVTDGTGLLGFAQFEDIKDAAQFSELIKRSVRSGVN